MIDENTEKALSLYVFAGLDDRDLECLIGRDSNNLTDEERQYVDDLVEDYNNYIQQQINKHNNENHD